MIEKWRSTAGAACRSVLELVYPSGIYCICCGKPILPSETYSICEDCMRLIRWANGRTCLKCGKILQDWYKPERCLDCGMTEHVFTRGFACVQYSEMERELVHDLKYGNKGYLARKMAGIMADRLKLEDFAPELIVPVPMYRRKQRLRGYNQSALIASALSRQMAIPCRKDLLLRLRDTEPMSGLSREERRLNLKDAFGGSPDAPGQIDGRTILLVDDVFTTGYTVDTCSSILLAYGAKNVYFIAFAAGANESLNERQ